MIDIKPPKACGRSDCSRPLYCRGFCSSHYLKIPEVAEARRRSIQKYRETEKGKEANRRKSKAWRDANPGKHLYGLAYSRAKEKGLPFSLVPSDVVIPEKCPIFGIPLMRGTSGKPCSNSPTIDRVIPELGYIPANIRVISRRANELKNNMTVDQLEMLFAWVRNETEKVKRELL